MALNAGKREKNRESENQNKSVESALSETQQ